MDGSIGLPDLTPLETAARLSTQWKPLRKDHNLRRLRQQTLALLSGLQAISNIRGNVEVIDAGDTDSYQRSRAEDADMLSRARKWMEGVQHTEPRVIHEVGRHFPELLMQFQSAYDAAYNKVKAVLEARDVPTNSATTGTSPYPDDYVVLAGSHVLVHTKSQREAFARYSRAIREAGADVQLIPPRSKSRPDRPAVIRGRAFPEPQRSRG